MTFCFFPRAEQLCFDAHGRIFLRRKSFGKDTRSLIINLSGGGDVSTEFHPGSLRAIGSKYKAYISVSNIWKTFSTSTHRRTSQGAVGGAAAPPVSEIFGQNAQNSGNKETIKNR